MKITRLTLPALFCACVSASATVYLDPLGDTLAPSGHYMDLVSVALTQEADVLYFDIDVGDNAGFAADTFARFMIGFHTVPGGDSSANAWSDQITLPGMDFFGGGATDGGTGAEISFFSRALGGWPEWQHGGSGSTWVHTSAVTIDADGIRFGVPLSTLGLSAGDSFTFDIYTAWASPGHAMDAMGLNSGAGTQSSWSTMAYDSGANVLSYTVIPEPTTFALFLGCGTFVLLLLRRRL